MEKEMMKISCPPECGFELKSHDESELLDLVEIHARNFHSDMGYTREDLKNIVQRV